MNNNIIEYPNNELSRLDSPSYNYDDNYFLYNIPIKRYFLPLVAISGILALDELHTYIYMPIVIFFCSLILFWNFPDIIIYMNSKPLYYEELFLVNATPNVIEISKDVRNKFEYIFDYSLLFTNALFTAGLADYWLYQSWNSNSFIEIVGITGGILKIFQSINYITGGIILYVVRFKIEQELDTITDSDVNIELDTISHNLEEITEDQIPDNQILDYNNTVNNSNVIFSMPTNSEVKDDIIIIHSNDSVNNNDTDHKQTVFIHMPKNI